MSVSLDEVSTQVRENADGRFRALLLASAMFEKMPAEVVFHATERLLGTVDFPDDSTHRLERPDLTENLRRIGASTDNERCVRLKTVTYGGAVRTYFWNCFPGLREDLRGWLDGALRMEIVGRRDRTTVLERFSEQCLRVGYPADLFWLIAQWGRDTRASHLLAAASHVLAQGLVDEQFVGLFRRQIYDWSVYRGLPRNLALELVQLCAEAIAPTRPEQALVRLRHLTRNNDRAVSDAARATLVALAAEDDIFLRRVVHRLADDLRRHQPWPTDLTLFTALADPARFITGARPLLSDPWFCGQIVDCWRALLVNRPADQWAELARRWLDAAAAGQDLLLDVLVAAAGERGDLHARLYVVARDWVAGDVARRRPAAELLRRGDQAQGLDLHGARPR